MIVRSDEAANALLSFVLGGVFAPPFAGFVVRTPAEIQGAYILNGCDAHEVHITAAMRSPWSIRDVREIARQCFVGLGVARITACTRADNDAALRILRGLGFVQEGRLRNRFGDADGLLFGLTRYDQKVVKLP